MGIVRIGLQDYDTDGNQGTGYAIKVISLTNELIENYLNPVSGAVAQLTFPMFATSTSSVPLTVGSGKTFTLSLQVPIQPGVRFVVTDTASITNRAAGVVQSFDAATKLMVGEFELVTGSGTISSWRLQFGTGATGLQGPPGTGISDSDAFILGGIW